MEQGAIRRNDGWGVMRVWTKSERFEFLRSELQMNDGGFEENMKYGI